MQICLDCSFVGTKHAFSDQAIGRLYSDYRTAAYNQERIRYEPTYAALANHVGASDQEVHTRVNGLTAWLADKIQSKNDFSMLDYGGSDGRFLPRIPGKSMYSKYPTVPHRKASSGSATKPTSPPIPTFR